MHQIMRWFQWTWVGLLFSDDDGGHDASRLFLSGLDQSGLACVAYSEALPFHYDMDKHQRIVTVMKTSTARVVFAFGFGPYIHKVLDEVCVIIHVRRM